MIAALKEWESPLLVVNSQDAFLLPWSKKEKK
jgi:hypothetical protein